MDLSTSFAELILQRIETAPVICNPLPWSEFLGMRGFDFAEHDRRRNFAIREKRNEAVVPKFEDLTRLLGDRRTNLDLVINFAELGLLDRYVKYTGPFIRPIKPCRLNSLNGFLWRLPYQLQHRDHYEFDVGRCGFFDDDENEMVHSAGLLAARHPALAEDFEPANYPSKFWFAEQVCPHWRLLCGAKNPPNLPDHLRTSNKFPPSNFWVQLPRDSAPSTSNREPAWEKNLLHNGQLPDGNEPDMQWVNVAPDSPVCRARDLHEARRMLDAAPSENHVDQTRTLTRHDFNTSTLGEDIGQFFWSYDGNLIYEKSGEKYSVPPARKTGPLSTYAPETLRQRLAASRMRERMQELTDEIRSLNLYCCRGMSPPTCG